MIKVRDLGKPDGLLLDTEPSDVVDRAKREQQFDRLLNAHGAALGRLAASYTHTSSDRDDLLQEVAIAIWQALPGFRGECSERTFLFRIAHNRAIAHLVKRRSQPATGEELDARDPTPDPETGLAREQQVEGLRRAIPQLPLVYRQPIMLALEGLGYGEIGEVLGISEGNVGARLTRARQMLRSLLERQR